MVVEHPAAIADTLESAVAHLPEPLPKGMVALLEVLDGALVQSGRALRSEAARTALEGITRGGRTKTVVRRILGRAAS